MYLFPQTRMPTKWGRTLNPDLMEQNHGWLIETHVQQICGNFQDLIYDAFSDQILGNVL